MSDTQEKQEHLRYCSVTPGNTYEVYTGPITDAFREALDDLRDRNFPNFNVTGTIHCMGVNLPFSLQDSVETLMTRYRGELDDIARAYGDDV